MKLTTILFFIKWGYTDSNSIFYIKNECAAEVLPHWLVPLSSIMHEQNKVNYKETKWIKHKTSEAVCMYIHTLINRQTQSRASLTEACIKCCSSMCCKIAPHWFVALWKTLYLNCLFFSPYSISVALTSLAAVPAINNTCQPNIIFLLFCCNIWRACSANT